jgi:hypothetical protein
MLRKITSRLKNLFKRKQLDPIDVELKKYPKKDRKRLKELWQQWQSGNYISVGK